MSRGGSTRPVSAIQVTADGSLHTDVTTHPPTFQVGNAFLYCTLTHTGVRQVLFTHGISAGEWSIRLCLGDVTLPFTRVHAAGHLLHALSHHPGCTARLISTLSPETPTIIHALDLHVPSPVDLELLVTLSPPPHPPRSAQVRQLLRSLGGNLPLIAWWQRGGAKRAQPTPVGNLRLTPDGTVIATSPHPVSWGASLPPTSATVEPDGSVTLRYSLTVTDQVRWYWACTLGTPTDLHYILARADAIITAAQEHHTWLRSHIPPQDPLRTSLFLACLEAALASFKRFPGDFSGFLAGIDYAYPPRIYFRDGYWTAQILLPLRPDLVRLHLINLARGIAPSGACPSGVFAPHVVPAGSRHDLRWLPDHFDSPSFFVLLLAEYVAWTDDLTILDEPVPRPALAPHRTLRDAAFACVRYLAQQDRDGDGLIEKPYRPNDWADNIRRNVWVTYDQALFAAAANAASYLASRAGLHPLSEEFARLATRARGALNTHLWLDAHGHYLDYARPGQVEAHMTLDSLVALRYHLVPAGRIPRLLQAATRLLTKNNAQQPFGDWGVMDVFPLYRFQRDLFGKSAQPFHYHNGADWPYLDGLLASVFAQYDHPETDYVLTRWWQYSLDQGWLTPIEYYSPAYPPGGLLQGWSSMPGAALLWMTRGLPPYPVPDMTGR